MCEMLWESRESCRLLTKVSTAETPAKSINDNELPSYADCYIPAAMATASCPFTASHANPVPHQEPQATCADNIRARTVQCLASTSGCPGA